MAKVRGYLRVTNWERYQHYKDRNPPWIKFYTALLEDASLRDLPIPTRLLWDQLLLLAARFDNAVEYDVNAIANVTRIPTRSVREGIPELVAKRMLKITRTRRKPPKHTESDASNGASASAINLASPSTETETEKQTAVKPQGLVNEGPEPTALLPFIPPTAKNGTRDVPAEEMVALLKACDQVDVNTRRVLHDLAAELEAADTAEAIVATDGYRVRRRTRYLVGTLQRKAREKAK